MKIRIVNCATKICKSQHKLANFNAIRTHHDGESVAEASIALQHQGRLAPQSHHALRNNEGKITFRPHHKPGHCAISKWPGPVNALTVPLCQETWGVPENQHQGRHWLSCALKSKTRENKYVNENAMNVKEKTLANPKNIDETKTHLHLMESTNCAVQASKLDSYMPNSKIARL